MRLAFGDLEADRQTAGIHHRVDLGRQPAARATHATGSRLFLTVGGVLVNPDRRGVDHLNVAIVSL